MSCSSALRFRAVTAPYDRSAHPGAPEDSAPEGKGLRTRSHEQLSFREGAQRTLCARWACSGAPKKNGAHQPKRRRRDPTGVLDAGVGAVSSHRVERRRKRLHPGLRACSTPQMTGCTPHLRSCIGRLQLKSPDNQAPQSAVSVWCIRKGGGGALWLK
jgi:hypothetical protein